jgi:hypothetical protein
MYLFVSNSLVYMYPVAAIDVSADLCASPALSKGRLAPRKMHHQPLQTGGACVDYSGA